MPSYFITSSIEKFSEASLVLPELVRLDIDLPELQELDARRIIAAKLKTALAGGRKPVIVEDTGLYLDGFNGFPGPLIKWMLKSIGTEKLAELVLNTGNSAAEARTCLGLLTESGEQKFFEGTVKGNIVKPRGQGFGWDAIFQPEGSSKTFGEMISTEKSAFSMRARAFVSLKQYLDKAGQG